MKHNVNALEPLAIKMFKQMEKEKLGGVIEAHYLITAYSIAASLKRIANHLEKGEK